MPLLKRKADGNFDDWRASSSSAGGSSPTMAKKAKLPSRARASPKKMASASQSASAPLPQQPINGDWFTDTSNNYSAIPGSSRYSQAPPMPMVAPATPMPPYQAPRQAVPPPWMQPTPTASSLPPAATKKAKAIPKEKRLARVRSSAPKATLDRLDRVASQRFFMIDRERASDELKEVFSVLGSTGNVYKVSIGHMVTCDCPDAQKGNHCKHIIFIFTKVLQVPRHSPYWYQRALLTSELQEVFAQAPAAPNSVANERVRDAHARATGKPVASASQAQNKNRRMPTKEDSCPICYEDNMHEQPEAKLEWCQECGNAVHKECFSQWETTSRNQAKKLTCVWCRADWIVVGGAGGTGLGARMGADGYLNLSGAAGLSPQRDTSSYYQGPRRGRRYYGYQPYDDDC